MAHRPQRGRNFVYWILIRLGACLALWPLLHRPFHWNKTEHGLSRWPGRGSSIRQR